MDDDASATESFDATEVSSVAASIRSVDTVWSTSSSATFGGVRWAPDLVSRKPKRVLHVHLARRLRPYVVERLRAAFRTGWEVHVALPLTALYDNELLIALASVDAHLHIIDGPEVRNSSAVLLEVAKSRIVVEARSRKAIAVDALAISDAAGSKSLRGRRFERLIVFLLSQVTDFDVVEHNYRTTTEELDVVVQQRSTGGRIWAGLGAPLILVEGKNWKVPVDQSVVSTLMTKMRNKHGSCRVAFLFGRSGFTSDAIRQAEKASTDPQTIVFVGPGELKAWAQADSFDDHVETLVRRAMLS